MKEISDTVIDISHYQGDVDFQLVKQSGILAVFHKATQGTEYIDKTYNQHRDDALAAGLLWGAYHFGDVGSGKDQAEHFLRIVGDNYKGMLLVLDFETTKMTEECANEFVTTIQKEKGKFPIVYGNYSFLNDHSTTILNQCPLWVARWKENPKPSDLLPKGWNDWTFWQYTSKGSVSGISGECDRDKFNGTAEEMTKFWKSYYALDHSVNSVVEEQDVANSSIKSNSIA